MIFNHPFTCLISGPTGSGKTFFIKKLLLSSLIYPAPCQILFYYTQYQPLYSELSKYLPIIKFIQGLPDNLNNTNRFEKPHLLIFDDLIDEVSKENEITKLFTRGSHHRNLSVILLTQNLFFKNIRTISLNCHFIILFKNARDKKQITSFASQIRPGETQFIKQSYEDATSKPHGYLILNLSPNTTETYQVTSGIFADEEPVVYLTKKKWKDIKNNS